MQLGSRPTASSRSQKLLTDNFFLKSHIMPTGIVVRSHILPTDNRISPSIGLTHCQLAVSLRSLILSAGNGVFHNRSHIMPTRSGIIISPSRSFQHWQCRWVSYLPTGSEISRSRFHILLKGSYANWYSFARSVASKFCLIHTTFSSVACKSHQQYENNQISLHGYHIPDKNCSELQSLTILVGKQYSLWFPCR